jgi:multidrug resistance protein
MLILIFIMVVNALSYATIIPIIYTYAQLYGINALGMSFLFASYSIAQLVATPFLGRLSDRFGRRPVLLVCIAGTAVSLGLFAVVKTFWLMVFARVLDGITGGNISVAQAVMSDTTQGEERAKAFGILGGAFGFGFLFGPALGGFMSSYSLTAPFWFSAALSLIAVIVGAIFLPETLDRNLKQINKEEPVFKLHTLYEALLKPFTGAVLLVSFLLACSLNAMVIGFNAFTVDILHLHSQQIGLFFTVFGIIGVVMQVFGLSAVMKRFHSKRDILTITVALSLITMITSYLSHSMWPFFFSMMGFGVFSAFRDPMIASLLSERTNKEDQGGILGINQAYISLGQIIGPLSAGVVSQALPINYVFFLAAVYLAIALMCTRWFYISRGNTLDL